MGVSLKGSVRLSVTGGAWEYVQSMLCRTPPQKALFCRLALTHLEGFNLAGGGFTPLALAAGAGRLSCDLAEMGRREVCCGKKCSVFGTSSGWCYGWASKGCHF